MNETYIKEKWYKQIYSWGTENNNKEKKVYKKRQSIYPIVQVKNGKYVREIYNRVQMNDLELSYQSVYNCLNGKSSKHKGYNFYYKDEYKKLTKEETIQILGIDANRNIKFKYNKLSECEVDLFNKENIRKCLKGKQSSHKGYIWIYSNELQLIDEKLHKFKNRVYGKERKVFYQYDEDEIIHKYNSLVEAENNGYVKSCIHKCLNGNMNTYLGYKWKYVK